MNGRPEKSPHFLQGGTSKAGKGRAMKLSRCRSASDAKSTPKCQIQVERLLQGTFEI